MLVSLLSGLLAAVHCVAAEPVEAAEPSRSLAYVLEPGRARAHTVALELDTRFAARTGNEEVVRQTSTALSFQVWTLGLRRKSAEATVVELVVRDFRLGLLTRTGASVVEATMDETGVTLRREGEKPRRVPWANVPRGRGGEVGELIGRPMVCTVDRRGSAVTVDRRMGPWSRVLDSLDLTPLILPLVPLPAMDVEPGLGWTVTNACTVQLSRPWGEVKLETRTTVSLVGFERQGDVEVARLAVASTAAPVEERPRFRYELSIEGEVLVGLDGAVVGGEANVTVVGSAVIVDSHYELAGTGTLRFGPAGEATAE